MALDLTKIDWEEYNPFKMWGAWLGAVVGGIILHQINVASSKVSWGIFNVITKFIKPIIPSCTSSGTCIPPACMPSPCMIEPLFATNIIISFIVLGIIIGFLIGWLIHSLIRKSRG